jgi:hypothetical protein
MACDSRGRRPSIYACEIAQLLDVGKAEHDARSKLRTFNAMRVSAASRFMDDHGYYISLNSFKGPWLEPAAIRNNTSMLPWNNIFCARKQLVDMQPAL